MTALAERRGPRPQNHGTEMSDFQTAAEPESERRDGPAEEIARQTPGERYAPLLLEFQAAIDVRFEREQRLAAELFEEQDARERELRADVDAGIATEQANVARIDAGYELPILS